MSDNRIERVHYFDRQFLRVQDFNDEQAYQIALMRRHNISNHTWGIVRGLEFEFNPNDGIYVIKSGLAVDGYGRELVLTEPHPAAITLFDSYDTDLLDIWLEYHLDAADRDSTSSACSDSNDTTDAFYRWIEQPQIIYHKETIYDSDRRKPRMVLSGDVEFDATRIPPDSPDFKFPVFLGQMRRDISLKQPYSAVLTGRPYAGLRGSKIQHPGENIQVDMGPSGTNENTAYFAVSVGNKKPDGTPAPPVLDIRPTSNKQAYEISLNGNTTVSGDINVFGAVNFQLPESKPSDGAKAAPEPKGKAKAVAEPKIEAQQQVSRPGTLSLNKSSDNVRELNIELGSVEKTPTRFSVGVWSDETKKFQPIFSVDADGSVKITGTLYATSVQHIPASYALTDDALKFLRDRQLNVRPGDVNAGNSLVDMLERILKILSGGKE